MKKLEKPNFNDLKNDFSFCISDSKYKTKIGNIFSDIMNQVKEYDEICSEKKCDSLSPLSLTAEMKEILYSLYDNNFVSKTIKGRTLYDKLLASSQICPYCNCGVVRTLDHYLPRAKKNGFPELSIISINLVPCCRDCNSLKHDDIGKSGFTKSYLHPYYDDVSSEQWLFAELLYSSSNIPTLRYFVKDVSSYSPQLNDRIKYHFEKLQIAKTYSILSAERLSTTIDRMKLHKLPETVVQQELQEFAEIEFKRNKNSIWAAMYSALANDTMFYKNCIQ